MQTSGRATALDIYDRRCHSKANMAKPRGSREGIPRLEQPIHPRPG
ncbi:hypothetical protein RIEGSTA812A_PEG_520 [invertebrate metagenome]|uniref:Uncharacterized protein n=1 Tax=invertebrate metagenome TaxID=1711999 RepID=A0A484H557_9ZZZZ